MKRMERYRVFVQDVGNDGYSASAFPDLMAYSPLDAIIEATGVRTQLIALRWMERRELPSSWGQRLIALPHSRKGLWPDGKTGKVPAEALRFNDPRRAA